MADKKESKGAHDPGTIDNKLADVWIDYQHPDNQRLEVNRQYNLHHESMNKVASFMDGIAKNGLNGKKIVWGKMDKDITHRIVGEYLVEYLEAYYTKGEDKAKIRTSFFKHLDRIKDPLKKAQFIQDIARTHLGDQKGQFINTLLGILEEGKSRDEVVNTMRDVGTKFYKQDQTLFQHESQKRYLAAFNDKHPWTMEDYITKHKLFKPYTIDKENEGDWAMNMDPGRAFNLLTPLVQAYHSKSTLSADELKKMGLTHKNAEDTPSTYSKAA